MLGHFVTMPESSNQKSLLRPKVIRNIGIVLFVLSFFAPFRWNDLRFFGGCFMFVAAPGFAFQEISVRPDEMLPHPITLFFVLMTTWLANFTIFTRLPLLVALIAILLPWFAYIYMFPELLDSIPFLSLGGRHRSHSYSEV
jgi:hypothetical protein